MLIKVRITSAVAGSSGRLLVLLVAVIWLTSESID